ncbi:GntR family transcriptional regulator [Actinomadura madurae]|uniref:GntR family transcriptional regulator n=1 Tax=Actinomadura madurae TaxID=1993 RepID=UPI0020D251FA|nr:GntR family transcriptional regulator [Actinomadura madurae]MCP9949333.1 GntR family transcriptional regulator [Actinomadura madurae]MCP9966090.1 GntR family transcriptional regulator [Actinomadura madurae]MCQ0014778.1 GntR family transcriptional regulator [Actinomadura madurae]
MSSLEFEPPKYARVVLELRRRIENGDYAPGAMLPSESQLVREFAVGRTTVVRALQMLQQDGWIIREHGRGSYVKGRPASSARPSRPGLAVLDQPETSPGVTLVEVGAVDAPGAVASLLGVDGGRVVARRWVTVRDGIASEVVTCWFPQELVYGTDLDKDAALPVGLRAHLRTVKGLRIDHITERLTARLTVGDEARLLQIKKSEPVLSVVASLHDAADVVRFVAEVVMPGSLHELEDVYSVPD